MHSNQTSKSDHILIVDDTLDNLLLVQTALERDEYRVSLAADGKTALEQVEKLLPDLILLDVMMPEMDGYEVTTRIRQNTSLPYIPILLITADERSSVVKGLDLGADDFIRKPLDLDELMARVRSMLRLKHSIDLEKKLKRQHEDFVSRLTHDLRTPLVAADRMLALFQEEAFGAIPLEMHEAINTMSVSNRNLLQMVNTLLEVYRHDAGFKKLRFSTFDLEEVIQEVVRELLPLAKERDLSLSTQVLTPINDQDDTLSQTLSSKVLGDRLELYRVLTNIVGNAIKFTEKGGIDICLTKVTMGAFSTERDRLNAWVTIEVKDTGAGIAPKDQESLFERFRPGLHQRSGSGLGLYLARCIIESHQGTIQLQSELGRGSTFIIRLPAQQNSK